MSDVNAGELHSLARALREIALLATAEPGEPRVSASLLAIVEDVSYRPGSSVGQIAERTGLAQSLVSTTVARLHATGALTTARDPADGRRKLVTISSSLRAGEFHTRGSRPIGDALRAALPDADSTRLDKITQALDLLVREVLG